jgi:hypothetical protein
MNEDIKEIQKLKEKCEDQRGNDDLENVRGTVVEWQKLFATVLDNTDATHENYHTLWKLYECNPPQAGKRIMVIKKLAQAADSLTEINNVFKETHNAPQAWPAVKECWNKLSFRDLDQANTEEEVQNIIDSTHPFCEAYHIAQLKLDDLRKRD